MSEITYSIHKNIDEIGLSQWDRVFGKTAEGYTFYKFLTGTGLAQFDFYFLVVRCSGQPSLIAPLFITDFNLDIAADGKLETLIRTGRRILPRLLIARTLFCGSPFSEYGMLGVHPDCPYEKAFGVLLKGIDELAAKTGSRFIIFKDFLESSRPLLDPLSRKGFNRIFSLPNVMVPTEYKSFPEYLAGLGRNTRKDLKRKLKAAQGAPVKVVEARDVSAQIDDIMRLYQNTYLNGKTKFERLNREFFLNVCREVDPHAFYFLYYVEGRLAAFNLCFIYDDLFIDKFIGFDYDVSRRHNLYFVSWANNVNWCIENGFKCYFPGQTGYAAKQRLGGRTVPLLIYVRHRSPFLNFLLKPLALILRPDNFQETTARKTSV